MTNEYNYDIKSLTSTATGGNTITTVGNYRIHTFTSTGTFTVNKPMNVEVLVVAGGGGGGGGAGSGVGGGGGGAGGLLYNNVFNVGIGANAVTIGSGGVGTYGGGNYESDLTEVSTTSFNLWYVKTMTAAAGTRTRISFDAKTSGSYGKVGYSINTVSSYSLPPGGGWISGSTYSTHTIDVTINSGDVVYIWAGTVGYGGAVYIQNVYLQVVPTGSSGQNSVFSTMTAVGGGRGASPGVVAALGGSGGGGGYNSVAPGSGTSGQGFAGGNASATTPFPTGGGGGAGAAGANYSGLQSGAGGVGLSYPISGSTVYYAGGGGGSYSTQGALAGAGGIGGGGAGTTSSNGVGGNGIANTGGGGGGAINANGGNGGSGIVIIRYLSSYDVTATSMTVSPPSESPCRAGICTVGVSVTWTNNASSASVSDLSITVGNGTSIISSSYPSVSFTANETKGPYTFTVSNMTAGTRSICPNPN